MHIILDRPSLTFAQQLNKGLSEKYIIVYSNELQKVNRLGIIKHLVENNKLLSFDLKYSVKSMNKCQIQKFQQSIFLRTPENTENGIIDMLLEKDENLLNYKISYPLTLLFETYSFDQIINSLTQTLSLKQNFEVIQKIGEGTFAQIYLAREIGTRYIRAIKIINKQRCVRHGSLSFISNQYQVLKNVESEWHVQLYYMFEDQDNVYFVIQWCPYGNLYTMINSNYKELSLEIKYTYFIQMCLELCKLHESGYIYRDLKPQNILIDYNGNAKLCDFGYAIKHTPGQIHTQICGSYEYIPPQLINKQGYNHSHDMYCLGLFFFEMLSGTNPFKGIGPKNLEQMSHRKINYDIQIVEPQTKNLLKLLLEQDPKKRIGNKVSSEIFLHPFFSKYQNLIVKIIKKQKIVHKSVDHVKINTLHMRKSIKVQKNNSKKVMLFGYNRVYNYLVPHFNVVQKMGPIMVSTENKKQNHN